MIYKLACCIPSISLFFTKSKGRKQEMPLCTFYTYTKNNRVEWRRPRPTPGYSAIWYGMVLFIQLLLATLLQSKFRTRLSAPGFPSVMKYRLTEPENLDFALGGNIDLRGKSNASHHVCLQARVEYVYKTNNFDRSTSNTSQTFTFFEN